MSEFSEYENTKHHPIKLLFGVATCLILLLVLAVLFVFYVRNATDDSPIRSSLVETTFAKLILGDKTESLPQISPKLADASEVVGDDGIVYGETPDGILYTIFGRGESGKQGSTTVTLVAVGDQIGTDNSLGLADGYAGTYYDGLYDFSPFYQEVKPFIQDFDLRYINQETPMGGPMYGYKGYPLFNSPDACASAIGNVDFNMISFCTNHTLDYGVEAALRSLDVLDQQTNSIVAGSYRSPEDRDTVHMIERNGKNFAFLAYTYGDNTSGTVENFPNQYSLSGFDKKVMETEIQRAQKVADAVIVCMHWGDEYTIEPNDQQWDYARFLADQNVDLVLGTHAHSVQPTKYVEGESGNVVPVVFGLSDFVSGWTLTDTIFSGLFTADFSWDDPNASDDISQGITVGEGGLALSNLKWYPSIEWSDGGQTYVRMLKDMDPATINANLRTEDVLNDWQHLYNLIEECDFDIEVVM